MKAILLGLWRAERITVAGALATAIVLPVDKWFTKETAIVLIGAVIAGVFKFLREQYGWDIKVI